MPYISPINNYNIFVWTLRDTIHHNQGSYNKYYDYMIRNEILVNKIIVLRFIDHEITV